MRYITNANGYVVTVSFGGDIECDWGICTEYTGGVPTGYTSLEAWYAGEAEKLYRWKIVNGQLTMDAGAAAPRQCNSLVDMVYPVGSIYMSVSAASPATLFGGTWERVKDRFLLAAGDTYTAGSAGGEAQHTLTEDEMPRHKHDRIRYVNNAGWTLGDSSGLGGTQTDTNSMRYTGAASYATCSHWETNSVGGGKAHNNMPPYLAVYVWRRTA